MLFGLCIYDTLNIDGRLDSIIVTPSKDRPLIADHLRDVGPSFGNDLDLGPLRFYTDEYGLSVQTATSVLRDPLFRREAHRLSFQIAHSHLALDEGHAGYYLLLLPGGFSGPVYVTHTDEFANICSSSPERQGYERSCDHSEIAFLADTKQLLITLSFFDRRRGRASGSDPFVRIAGRLVVDASPPDGARTSTVMDVFRKPFAGIHFSPVDKILKAVHYKRSDVPPASAFLCHSSADKAHARRLALELATRGVRPWLDEAEIRIGDSLIEKIEQGVVTTTCVVPILSKHSVASPWCQEELRMALATQIASGGKRVLPVLIDDCRIPGFLLEKAYCNLKDDETYDREVDKLAADIKYRACGA